MGDLFKNKKILVTGGTGSFGHRIVQRLIEHQPAEIRIYSRDEKKQYDMRNAYQDVPFMKFFIGDVRDKTRLMEVMEGTEIVFHAAALKQVPNCELHPQEAVKTNILGMMNIIDCAKKCGVERVVDISTDKAVKPVNAMGISKAMQEKLVIAANDLSNKTKFACVRYGNVMGSRGSAIPLFRKLVRLGKEITITHEEMTRFMLTLDDAIDLVFFAAEHMEGGETFVKKAPSTKIVDLAKLIYRKEKGTDEGFSYRVIGMFPGEKIHEILISEEEMSRSEDRGDFFIIRKAKENKMPRFFENKEGQPQSSAVLEEYSSKVVITDDNAIEALLNSADKAAEETKYREAIFTK